MSEEVDPVEAAAYVKEILGPITSFLKREYPNLDGDAGPRILQEVSLQIATLGARAPKEKFTTREVFLFGIGYIRGLLGPT